MHANALEKFYCISALQVIVVKLVVVVLQAGITCRIALFAAAGAVSDFVVAICYIIRVMRNCPFAKRDNV